MIRADHPNNVKRGGVCFYVKESLTVCNFSNSYLSECQTLEVTIGNKKGYVITLYRSPSQASDQLDYFTRNLQKLLINIISFDRHFVIQTRITPNLDTFYVVFFNPKSKFWSVIDIATEEGIMLEHLSSLFGMKQLISAPKHILHIPQAALTIFLSTS